MECWGRWGCSRPSGDKVVTSGTSQVWGCSRPSGDKVVTSGTRQGGGGQRAHTHSPARASHSLLLPVGAARTDRSAPRCKRTRGTRWTPGGAGGVTIPTPYSKAPACARIASGVPHHRSGDCLVWPGTVQAEKGAMSHNAMRGRGTGRYGCQRGTDRRG